MSREVSITIQPGVLGLLADKDRQERLHKSFEGDLGQMAAQKRFFENLGFSIGVSGGVPGFRTEEDYKRGVRLLWDCQCEGWWNYNHQFVELGICTKEEFMTKLKAFNARGKT